jgi:tetratricopeptide (TPR) repeat protein
MTSVNNVSGPGMAINFIKKRSPWVQLFAFWLGSLFIAIGALSLKEHKQWFAATRQEVDSRYAINMLNFNMPGTYLPLAEALAQGKPIDANYQTYYELTAEFLPQDFASHYLLALCYHSRGQAEQAAQSYRKSLTLNPNFFWAYYNLGLLYWQGGQPADARRIWGAALSGSPEVTIKSLTTTRLLGDCLKDLLPKGYDILASLRRGIENAVEWAEGESQPKDAKLTLF